MAIETIERPKIKRKYFTLKQAQELTRVVPKNLTDNQLQKAYVKARDYLHIINSGDRERLAEGGYYVSALTDTTKGVVPKDMWLQQNLNTTLTELTEERQKRMTKPSTEAKEPWQMTREEFIKDFTEKATGSFRQKIPDAPYRVLKYDAERHASDFHKEYVQKALKEGKAVPAEVLKDYPELGKRETPRLTKLTDQLDKLPGIEKTYWKGDTSTLTVYYDEAEGKDAANIRVQNYLKENQLRDSVEKINFISTEKGIFKPEPKAESKPRAKRETLVDKVMNEVVLYGGFPVRYGTMVKHLDEVAKSTGEKNWMAIRDAGLMGHATREKLHPTKLPEDVQPLTYEEFERITNLASGEKIPESIHKKIITMYPKEERHRFETKETKESLAPAKAEAKPKEETIKILRGSTDPEVKRLWDEVEDYRKREIAPLVKVSDNLQRRRAEGEKGLDDDIGKVRKQIAEKQAKGQPMYEAWRKKFNEVVEIPVSKFKTRARPKAKPKKESKPQKEIAILRAKPSVGGIQDKRSERAIAIDRALLAKRVVTVNDADVWRRTPNRVDIRGIDTPGSGRVTSRTGFADRGKTRLSRGHHRGWKKAKLT